MKAPLAIALLLAACRSSAPPPPVPLPDSVPSAVIESFCSLLHGEGMMSEIRVLKTTQPIITTESMQALADRTMESPSKRPLVGGTISGTPLPVEIPSGSCVTQAIDRFDPARDSDVMVLQLSVPFPNPFTGRQPGVLARFSLGNESPTWYWIPIGGRDGRWVAGRPVMLAAR